MFRINLNKHITETISALLLYSVIISIIFVIKIITMKLNTTIYLPEDLKRDLKVRAAKLGITMNQAIVIALKSYLK